jgi:hypothetical protein
MLHETCQEYRGHENELDSQKQQIAALNTTKQEKMVINCQLLRRVHFLSARCVTEASVSSEFLMAISQYELSIQIQFQRS